MSEISRVQVIDIDGLAHVQNLQDATELLEQNFHARRAVSFLVEIARFTSLRN